MTSAPGPWKARSSARLVAPATKVRPYSPSVSHGTSDAGLPDTDAVVSATTPGAVVVSYCRKRSLTQSKNGLVTMLLGIAAALSLSSRPSSSPKGYGNTS